MTRLTSIEAYTWLQDEAILNSKQEEVLKCIMKFPELTDREITKALGYDDPNKVRPRRRELFDLGIIKSYGIKECSISGMRATSWIIKSEINTLFVGTHKVKTRIKVKDLSAFLLSKYKNCKKKCCKLLLEELRDEVFKL